MLKNKNDSIGMPASALAAAAGYASEHRVRVVDGSLQPA
jgi:hypothetical protein